MVQFNTIPGPRALRKPGVYSEIDNSRATNGTAGITFTRLILAQMLPSGTAKPLVPVVVTSNGKADQLFGAGSMAAGMVRAALAQDDYTALVVMPISDDPSAADATGSITIGGAPTVAGTLNLRIAGRAVNVGVSTGAALATIAAAVAAAINAAADMPVTAAAANGVVTVTAKNAGLAGNGIDLRVNYYVGEELPAGLTVTFAQMSGGATNPSIADALAALGDTWYNAIAMPYTDATNLGLLKTELEDRFQWDREIEGFAFAAFDGTQGQLATLGSQHNSPHLAIDMAYAEPMPAYEHAAELMAIAALNYGLDPARPLTSLAYKWCLGPAKADLLTGQERNLLLFDGISTNTVDNDGTLRVERLITTYQTAASGAEDTSYLQPETLFTLSYIRHDWRDTLRLKYPRHKLANDGTRYAAGQAVVTPTVIRAEAVAKFRDWEERGLVEQAENFKAGLVVERNAQDTTRLDVLLPPDLVGPLFIIANQIQFRL